MNSGVGRIVIGSGLMIALQWQMQPATTGSVPNFMQQLSIICV
jgi:hypothetical protein